MPPSKEKMPPTQAGDRPPMLTRMVSLVRSFAPIPGLTNPARSLACLAMAPTLGGHLPGCANRSHEFRRRLPSVGDSITFARHHVTAIAKAMSRTTAQPDVLRPGCCGRLPCPSQAPTTPCTALPGLAKSPASRLPRPSLLPAKSLPRVLPRPPSARPYAVGYLSVGRLPSIAHFPGKPSLP